MKEKTTVRPPVMVVIILITVFFSFLFYLVGSQLFNSPFSYYEYLQISVLLAVVITGGYQIFFWTQRNNYYFKTHCHKTGLDDWFPFWPRWVWIYNFVYYLLIGSVVIFIPSFADLVLFIFGGLVLLALQCAASLFYPCVVPKSFRQYKADTLSKKYLRLSQGLDNGRNCFPSMHMSVSTYVGFILLPVLGVWAYVSIALIFFSCLFVKQHQIVDLVPGMALGWLVYIVIL